MHHIRLDSCSVLTTSTKRRVKGLARPHHRDCERVECPKCGEKFRSGTSVSACLLSLISLTTATLRSMYRFLMSRFNWSPLQLFLVGRKTHSYRRTHHAADVSLKFFTGHNGPPCSWPDGFSSDSAGMNKRSVHLPGDALVCIGLALPSGGMQSHPFFSLRFSLPLSHFLLS
jgi:hypothetical protein